MIEIVKLKVKKSAKTQTKYTKKIPKKLTKKTSENSKTVKKETIGVGREVESDRMVCCSDKEQ